MTEDQKILPHFDINCVKIMTHLLANDVVNDEVLETIHELELDYYTLLDKNKLLEEKINIDAKTNLFKYKEDYLVIIVKTASRVLDRPVLKSNYIITFTRFDIDNFSYINNKFGHDKGDTILVDITKIIKDNSRPTDYVIRFGGEEFDVILPATDEKGALVYLDKMFSKIRKLEYNFNGEKLKVSVSAGISSLKIPYEQLKKIDAKKIKSEYKKLQSNADHALYDAKLSGKDNYKIYSDKKDYHTIREKYAQIPKTGI